MHRRMESQSAQLGEMSSRSQQNALNLSESSAQNFASSARNMVNLSESLAKLESSGNAANLGVSTEQSQAVHKGSSLINDFANQHQIDSVKSAQILTNASFGNDKGGGLFGGSVSMGGSINGSDQELYTKAQKFAQDHNFQDAMRQASQASNTLSHTLNDESSKRLAEEVSGSYEQGMSQRNEASKSFRAAEDYSNQASSTRANSATINYNANQQFGEWLAAQPADNTSGHIGHRGAAHIMAHSPQQTMAYASRYMAEKGLNPANTVSSSNSQIKSSYAQEQGHQVHAVTRESMNAVRQQASELMSNANHGQSTRESVETQMAQNKEAIKNDSSGVLVHGAHLQQNVATEQNKGVVRRVGAKGIKEVYNLIPGGGEAQQK